MHDLALDLAGRFRAEMGEQFVSDFTLGRGRRGDAFALLTRKLEALGSFYGALPRA